MYQIKYFIISFYLYPFFQKRVPQHRIYFLPEIPHGIDNNSIKSISQTHGNIHRVLCFRTWVHYTTRKTNIHSESRDVSLYQDIPHESEGILAFSCEGTAQHLHLCSVHPSVCPSVSKLISDCLVSL